MSFLTPAALALALLAIPIILLYMLRLRRRRQVISSTILWRELVRDRSANAPWQRLQRNILLLLQLLILAALVVALARPTFSSPQRINGNLIVLLDASASMTATDSDDGVSRFDQALDQTRRLIDGLGGNDQMTLITVGRLPMVIGGPTNDGQLLRRELSSLAPEAASPDWVAAFALAAGLAQGTVDPRLVIISDGSLSEALPAFAGNVMFMPVGRSAENLAISTLGSRASNDALELLVGVTNFGPANSEAVLSIYVDEQLFDSRRIEIRPEQDEQFSWTLPGDVNTVQAAIVPTGDTVDYLALDNQAWVLAGRGKSERVLLVSDGNLFLERLFAVLPGYVLTRVASIDDIDNSEGRAFELYIFDGVPIPDPLPAANVLIFDPQPSSDIGGVSPAIAVTGVFTDTAVTRMADDARLADVDWRDINIAQARKVEAGGLIPLMASDEAPLLLAGEINGRRVAVFPFDLAASDLPLQIAFPVIMANIAAWLSSGSTWVAADEIEPGTIVTLLPDARAESMIVTLPNGETRQLAVTADTGPILFDETSLPGVYVVSTQDSNAEPTQSGRFAVNFFEPGESRIAPSNTIDIGQREVSSTSDQTPGRQEVWPYVLAVGLLLLLIEWWITYHRGLQRFLLKY